MKYEHDSVYSSHFEFDCYFAPSSSTFYSNKLYLIYKAFYKTFHEALQPFLFHIIEVIAIWLNWSDRKDPLW